MALKTLVKVGKISNLSDARYCAGMSVDMLGFGVVSGQAHYVSPELFKELRGWFTGPAVVAEAYGIEKQEDLATIVKHYLPDFIEGNLADIRKLHSAFSAYILSTTYAEIKAHEEDLGLYRNQIAYVILPSSTPANEIEELSKDHKVLLQIDPSNTAEEVLHNAFIKGIVMQGSAEDKPGLKNYDVLATILEKLEIDD